ncbi:hypothetical protein SKAU_G00155860 [Synaphobranchus kaupii]|uniref:CCHC-type domain-containing protein n=1 Tax=Synaphobranchus kaupii TaxID=118154 RepID=A0A9Q1FHN9_SYNKA|nr:hypothetical protein SKAU_G00155860 [Synaphobranchus kaupii]
MWGVKAVSPIKRRKWPGTDIVDGTRFVKVKFSEQVKSLPYSTKFNTLEGSEYFRVIHDKQIRVCRLCIQPGHVLRECPDFLCRKCGKQGHYARECATVICRECRREKRECICREEGEEQNGRADENPEPPLGEEEAEELVSMGESEGEESGERETATTQSSQLEATPAKSGVAQTQQQQDTMGSTMDNVFPEESRSQERDPQVPRFDSIVREELELVLTPDKETAGEEESGESDVEEPEEVAESEEEDITDSLDTAVAEMGPTQVEDESAPKKEGREASQIPQPAEVEKTTQATVPETSRVSQEGPDAETGSDAAPAKTVDNGGYKLLFSKSSSEMSGDDEALAALAIIKQQRSSPSKVGGKRTKKRRHKCG